ncbi:MAG TPA: acyltransferase [Egibacteraceae bacterium]|nr:acyltransferase [Egibacteraceae bacterium]
MPGDLTANEARELAGDLAEQHRQAAVAAAVGREGVARAEALGAAMGAHAGPARAPSLPPGATDWRRAVRFAVERRMYTPQYLQLYARFLAHRLRHPHVELEGMVFLGRRVELTARRGYGRLSLGAWCWIGSDNRLRAHEGNLRLARRVVMGRDNVVNAYLDIEIGQNALLGDWIYVCDFDHITEHVHVPIRKQGIVKTPVRIGEDVWVGEKASILRGADIGAGSVIASQSLVRGPIPPFSIAVGSPARVIRSRLPPGMTAEEALALQRGGQPVPDDPLDG